MRARRALRFGALVLLACAARLGRADSLAMRVAIAPVEVVDGMSRAAEPRFRLQSDLLEALGGIPFGDALRFSPARGGGEPPASLLEAARLCEEGNYPYLLYGYIRASGGLCYSELKLISREGKRVAAVFASADDEDHYSRLVEDLSSKIARYFLADLGIRGAAPNPVSRNAFELPASLGYWAPLGRWSAPVAGVAAGELGLRFIPVDHLGTLASRPWYLAASLRVEYALGMSRPGFETAFLHRVTARLPVEAGLGIGAADELRASAGALVSFDILSQDRKYGARAVETAAAGGLFVGLSYFRGLSERLRLGFSCRLDAVLYEDPLFLFSPAVAIEFLLGGSND